MDDDLERLNRLLDDLAAERDPQDRGTLSAEEVRLAETAAFLKAGNPSRALPDDAFVEQLGARLAAAQKGDGRGEARPTAPDNGVSRRHLLRRVAVAAAGVAAGAAGGVAARGMADQAAAKTEADQAYRRGIDEGVKRATSQGFSTPLVPEDRGRWIKTPYKAGDIGPGQARRFRAGALEGFLVNTGHGDIFAVSAACTHMGCLLTWLDGADTFLCPCHGAQYNADGTVLSGIARHPLPRLKIKPDRQGYYRVWSVDEHPAVTTVSEYKGF